MGTVLEIGTVVALLPKADVFILCAENSLSHLLRAQIDANLSSHISVPTKLILQDLLACLIKMSIKR